MSNAHSTDTAGQYVIDWDMGEYGPFPTYSDASEYQRQHAMRGSTIVRIPMSY